MKRTSTFDDYFEDDELPLYDCFDDPNETTDKPHAVPLPQSIISGMTLLDKLEYLIDLADGCELSSDFFELHKELIQSVADELQLTPSQTVMLCPYINKPCCNVNMEEMQNYFGCSPITIMRHTDDLTALLRRRYISISNTFNRTDSIKRLTEKARKALCNNHGLPCVKTSGLSPMEFLNRFRALSSEAFNSQDISYEEFIAEVMQLLSENPQLKIAQAINDLRVSDDEKIIILVFCKLLVFGGVELVALNDLDDYVEDFYGFSDAMSKGCHPFVKDGWLTQLAKANLFSRDLFSLSDKARNHFLSEFTLPKKESGNEDFEHTTIIPCKRITPKTLFYSAEDQGQIDTLKGLLEDKQLKAIRKRLESANMRKGFNCLFYGLPGTGKTETALQLARLTKRDIMQVDISEIRDKWYGETEKIVKGIFDDYARLVHASKRIPILLINEADALLSVRTNIGGNNPTLEKTENAIQNILLECMENLDGILIATTNLTCNLDSAFERRFLYKIEFHQPSTEAKMNIWRSFLPSLDENNALTLANNFDFSGGQIENIARKVIVDQLLFGDTPSLEHLEKLCAQETLKGNLNQQRRIGFNCQQRKLA